MVHLDILDLCATPITTAYSKRFTFSKSNYDEINLFFNKRDWHSLFQPHSVDEAVEFFYLKVHDSIELFVPKEGVTNHSYHVLYSPELVRNRKYTEGGKVRDYDEFAFLKCNVCRICVIENLLRTLKT